MLLETVLLLSYQARSGALYERLGLLLVAFMLGLAAGAAGVNRLLARAGPARIAAALNLSLIVLGGVAVAIAATGAAAGLWSTAALLFAAGALTAGIFACAAGQAGARGHAIGRLYASDLAGGAAGSLLAAMVLIPSAGLATTASLVCATGVAGLILWRYSRFAASAASRDRTVVVIVMWPNSSWPLKRSTR